MNQVSLPINHDFHYIDACIYIYIRACIVNMVDKYMHVYVCVYVCVYICVHAYHRYIISHSHTHAHNHRLVEWVGEEPRTAGGRAWKKVCFATKIACMKVIHVVTFESKYN